MQYFGESEGRVKIQMMIKNLQRYYTLKCLMRDLLSNGFLQNSDLPRFLIFRAVGGIRRVQISCDTCTRFACYLYSTKQCWIIRMRSVIRVKCIGTVARYEEIFPVP